MLDIFIITENLEIQRSTVSDIKEKSIDYKGWYCPIYDWTLLAHHDGSLRSGICGEKKYATWKDPWWEKKNFNIKSTPHCPFTKRSCFCITDLKAPKAVDKETYDMLFGIKADEVTKEYSGDEIIGYISKDFLQNNKFSLHIDIGNKCNFDCSYCPPHTHDNSSPFISVDKIKHLLNTIQIDKRKNKSCTITGGEPTLFKDLEVALKLLREKGYFININTNGTASESKLEKLIQNYDCRLVFSLHQEFTTDKIIAKINRVKEKFPKMVNIKYMGDTTNDFFKRTVDVIPVTNLEVSKIYDKTATEYVLKE